MPVKLVSEDQSVDPNTGELVDVYSLTYTPDSHPGAFTVTAPKSADAVAQAQAGVDQLNAILNSLYAIQ